MKLIQVALGAALAAGAIGNALALSPGETVDNFRLLDQRGDSHELYYLSDMKAVVLMVQQNGCKESSGSIARLNELRDQYKARGVEVLMLNSSLKDDRASIAAETQKLGTTIPVLDDELQLIGESLDATRAGEVLVINPVGWKLEYRGPVASGKSNYAADAVESLTTGQPVKTAKAAAKGCSVRMPEYDARRAHEKISYSKTIAPMLEDKCVTCHRTGGIGPWQMTSYDMVKGFSPMIREVLRTERMPPWHADPHYGAFRNDRSLSNEQVKTLVHWIEAGSPKDKADDPLLAFKKDWPQWAHGTPDAIIEIPAFNVPATGTVAYQNPVVKNTIGRDVWIRAVDFTPGDRTVVHHILAYGTKPGGNPNDPQRALKDSFLGGYVPGQAVNVYPTDTGVFIPKDNDFRFQIHYTATGKASTDVTHVALYFTDAAPKYPLKNVVLLNPRLKIPPNTKDHLETTTRTFDRDVLVYALTAHSHYRGRASKFVAYYPDGREETLLSVPKYDFNWQTAYELKEPKVLPKGTKLVYTTIYDNSVQNKANPDPNIEVHWGEQTWEEMIYGNVRIRYLDETTETVKAAANDPAH
jgi:hypothetical protein